MKYTIDTVKKTICLDEECSLNDFIKAFRSGYDGYKILPKIDYQLYPPVYPTYVPDVYTPVVTTFAGGGSAGTGSGPMNEKNKN